MLDKIHQLEKFISVAGIYLGCFSGILLVILNRQRKAEQYMLAAIFLILSWYAFFHPAKLYGWLSSYPFMLRIGVPFYYLVPPFIFWYSSIKLGWRGKKWKYVSVHLALFFIGLTDISWYYIRDHEHLHEIALSVAQNFNYLFSTAEGFLPAVTHYILRPLQGCIYCLYSCYVCYAAYKKGMFQKLSLPLRGWLMLFNLGMAVIYLMLFYMTIISPPESMPWAGYYDGVWSATFMTVLFCLLGAAALFCPTVLYQKNVTAGVSKVGFPAAGMPPSSVAINNNEPAAIVELSQQAMSGYVNDIEEAMLSADAFKQMYVIDDLLAKLNIPYTDLVYVLSKHYHQDFNDFVNSFKIRYIIGELQSKKSENLNADWIRREAGFTSGDAFSAAFKKYTGVYPDQFLKKAV
ncbi:hypothetical protein DJ568_16705 [Mucilaginibacter hurinus]|uniref:HTH araC/xylS-type domain-containing protein n=1 Tax=Mucilaginibacter hurinus TaxID=2201324 RepID=A0A367GL06_9SPHI|nr:hypothetical protein [Mucilaginibacter hurinus]RCH53675.1 hypothetical protein DJ568_16705 [Mucilaginibacter hurinus]